MKKTTKKSAAKSKSKGGRLAAYEETAPSPPEPQPGSPAAKMEEAKKKELTLDDIPDPSPGDVPESVIPAGAAEFREDPAIAFAKETPASGVLAALMKAGWQVYFLARQSLVDLCREKGLDDEATAKIVSTFGQAMHVEAEQGRVDPAELLRIANETMIPFLEKRAAA